MGVTICQAVEEGFGFPAFDLDRDRSPQRGGSNCRRACASSSPTWTGTDIQGEILVVSDGSTDETEARVLEVQDSRVHLVRLSEHSGKAVAISRGCAQATGRSSCWRTRGRRGIPRPWSTCWRTSRIPAWARSAETSCSSAAKEHWGASGCTGDSKSGCAARSPACIRVWG